MSYEKPTPPAELPEPAAERLDAYSPDELRAVASYADALAEYRERAERLSGDDADQAATADRPDGVPAKASTTVKEINGNRYSYWQWREGDTVRSQYEGPVEGEE
ncbi:hypothetical protein [Halolamina rubra]|uniref:hypothetical protein n=1 Tax=Halolamina rubra TaxID=1380430 RepID=UPI000679A400|nr:hypothetical protein [Halolamina rubra]